MNLRFVKATQENKEEVTEMIREWKKDIVKNHTHPSPRALFRNDVENYDYYIKHLDREEELDGMPPHTTYFCVDTDRNLMIGAVNIRHYLTEYNVVTGGHIADGVRPSERRKGYATAMIALALEECRKMGIESVLMTCNKENIGSAKSIMKNGGVLENEVEEDGEIEQRYWIKL